MTNKNSNVIIENGKVIFSQEIIDYFENLRTEENSVWIDKYFKVLSDTSNFDASKYNIHHIIPCFTFKDKTHKIRKETRIFADKIKENLIKLSVYNHILAHYCLWRIFKTNDSKNPVILMCNNKYIESLTENQIKEIAKLQEEIAKENMTDEEKRMYEKKYREEHKKKMKIYNENYRKDNKEELSKKSKKYYENHKETRLNYANEYAKSHKEEKVEYDKNYRKKNKEKLKEQNKKYREENKDEIKKKSKKYRDEHKEERKEYDRDYRKKNRIKINKYKKEYREGHEEQNKKSQQKYNESHKKERKQYREEHKEEKARYDEEYRRRNKEKISKRKKENYEKNKDKISEKGKQLCFDPIKNKPCTLNALKHRKQRNKEDYKNINPNECII
jgi:hypothetical protein